MGGLRTVNLNSLLPQSRWDGLESPDISTGRTSRPHCIRAAAGTSPITLHERSLPLEIIATWSGKERSARHDPYELYEKATSS